MVPNCFIVIRLISVFQNNSWIISKAEQNLHSAKNYISRVNYFRSRTVNANFSIPSSCRKSKYIGSYQHILLNMKKCNFRPLYGIRFVQRYSNLKTKKETSLNCEEPPFYSSIQSIFGQNLLSKFCISRYFWSCCVNRAPLTNFDHQFMFLIG